MNKIMTVILLSLLAINVPSQAQTRATFENDIIKLRIATNTPQAISAFYEGRGFQKNMIALLHQQCYVSVFILNKSNDFVWLDLSQWQFSNEDGDIKRLDRTYWRDRWQQMKIPMAHQSTFRWTLIPEILNFYPKEKEGGNIILPRLGKPFNINARFDSGKDRKGQPVMVNLKNITCAVEQ